MKKNIFLKIIFCLIITVYYYNNANAGVYFIEKNDDGNQNKLGRCVDRGYTQTGNCTAPKIKTDLCKENSKYYKSCSCPAEYSKTKEDCAKEGKTPTGNNCDGKYTGCGCDSEKYKILKKDCEDINGMVTGEKCGDKYEGCRCRPEFKYYCLDPGKPGIGPNCVGLYKECGCSGLECDNGGALGATKCVKDGKTLWSSCKEKTKTCNDYGEVANIPTGQECTASTHGSLTCYKNCKNKTKKTCEEEEYYSTSYEHGWKYHISKIDKRENCQIREFDDKTCYYDCKGKYLIVEDMPHPTNPKLHRIRAINDFTTPSGKKVKRGDLGGYIERIENLEGGDLFDTVTSVHFDNSWVYDNGQISGIAQAYIKSEVYGNAIVKGNTRLYAGAKIYGNAVVDGGDDGNIDDILRKLTIMGEIYGDARVSGEATIYSDAKIYDHAKVYGNAIISGGKIYGNAQVYDEAQVLSEKTEIYGNAKVYDNAHINSPAGDNKKGTKIYGKAEIYEYASVFDAEVYGNAKVYGTTQIHDRGIIRDNAQVYDEVIMNGGEVYNNAKVYEWASPNNTKIYGNAKVYGFAKTVGGKVYGDAKLHGYSTEVKDADISSGEYACGIFAEPSKDWFNCKIN